ncbi:alpha/beta hydrolase [Actinocorallia sp. B10E7]|uniref:alpha/beta fold hydrolase n=1 Tax=Actinocorallia sp. B10E7 TaxID=3153558 RepID=UPI00325E9C6A
MRVHLATVLGLVLTMPVVIPAEAAAPRKPTVVLVHGAFGDASGWSSTIRGLKKAGYPVLAPANPLRELAGDAAYVSSVLRTVKGPVVLVGHSYGGMVISNAAVGHPNVKALVYIAALMPKKGESAAALDARYPGATASRSLIRRPIPGGGVDFYLDPAAFRSALGADLPRSVTSVMAVTQRPITAAALRAPSRASAWTSIPSWYLVTGRDKAVPPRMQRFMAGRARARVFTAPKASHLVFRSRPALTVSVIEAAAKAAT